MKIKNRWFRSHTGAAAKVTGTRTKDQYRLLYLSGIRGTRVWTEDEILAHAKRWLKRKPKV